MAEMTIEVSYCNVADIRLVTRFEWHCRDRKVQIGFDTAMVAQHRSYPSVVQECRAARPPPSDHHPLRTPANRDRRPLMKTDFVEAANLSLRCKQQKEAHFVETRPDPSGQRLAFVEQNITAIDRKSVV